MDDKEALDELIDCAGEGISIELANHAIRAIEKLAKVRELANSDDFVHHNLQSLVALRKLVNP